MKALVLAPFSKEALQWLGRLMPLTHESWTETKRLYDPEELGLRMKEEGTSHLIVEADFIYEEVFQHASDFRFLGVCRSALDHVDLGAATEHNVLVVNTPGRNAEAVAELTIALMLSLARRVPSLDRYVKTGGWQDPVEGYINNQGIELRGKTLGLVGLGAVGGTVSKLATSMGMEVLAYDPFAGAEGQRKSGALLVSLEHLLKESLFLSLHAPATDATTGLIGEGELGAMIKGAYLINTAFYEMVKEDALVKALASGRLAGAALDVHESHPISPTSPLLKLDNVLLTPHVGGGTAETVQRHSTMILKDIERHLQGVKPLNLANPKVWDNLGP